MSKNKKIIIALAVAVIFAILAGVSVYAFMSPKRSTLYVFNDSYKAGTTITSNMLSPIKADSTIVVAGQRQNANTRFVTESEMSQIIRNGDSLRMDVVAGMPLMASMCSSIGGNSIEMAMSPSGIAVTVPVNDVTGVTNELRQGAHVNVYVTNSAGGTYLAFENMIILQVTKSGTGSLQSATFEVNNEDALKLINITKSSSIYLGLINGSGYQYQTVPDEDDELMKIINDQNEQQEPEETGETEQSGEKPDNEASFNVNP